MITYRFRVLMSIFIIFIMVNIGYSQTSLDDYLKLAAENNTELKASFIEYQMALQDVKGVGALPDPNVSFGYFISTPETRVGAQQFKISAKQMFPWFGTLNSKEDVYSKIAKIKYRKFEDKKNKLFFRVKSSYFKVYEWQEAVTFKKEFLVDLELLRKLVLTKYKTGGRLSDVLQLDIKIEEAKMENESILDKKNSVESNFTQWLNVEEGVVVDIPKKLQLHKITLNGVVDSLLRNNLLLSQKDLQIEASKLQIIVAEKLALPQIGLGLDYVNVSERADVENLIDNGKDIFMPMVSISIPFFDSRKKADREMAKLKSLKYQSEREQLVFSLKDALNKAIFDYNEAVRKEKLAKKQSQLAEQTRSLIVNEYSTGTADIQELIYIYQKILDYKFAHAKAITEINTSVAFLYELINKK